MRAWTYTRRGLPSQVVQLDPHFRAPSLSDIGPDDVLVEINYAAMKGGVALMMQVLPPLPFSFWTAKNSIAIPELDFSGTILAVGRNVLATRVDLRPGTPVFGSCRPVEHFRLGRGTLAEYVVAPASRVVPVAIPGEEEESKLSLAEAAGIGAVGATALQTLDLCGLKTGDKVLVNGGSGGTGVMMVQVARHIVGESGQVVATCSAANAELVKSLGADEVIDYRKHDPLHEYLRVSHAAKPFDAIIDCIGVQDLYTHSPEYLAPGKPYLNIGAYTATPTLAGLLAWAWTQISNRFWPTFLGGVPRPYIFHSATPDVQTLNRVKQLVAEGKLRQVVDSIWEMEDVPRVSTIKNSFFIIDTHVC